MAASSSLSKYEQTKRWAYILSIIAIATVAFGVDIRPEGQFAGLSFTLQSGFEVQDILALVLLILLVRMLFEWTDLPIADRKNTFNIFDHWLGSTLTVATLLQIFSSRQNIIDPTYASYVSWSVFAAFQLAFLSRLPVLQLALDRVWHGFGGIYESDSNELERLLTLVPYVLYFNPDHPQLSKRMVFTAGGVISEGRNSNEDSWRVSRGKLEILSADGRVFSRFRFNKRILAWVHTNSLFTRSLKNQYLLIAS